MPLELKASRAKQNSSLYTRTVAEEIALIDVYIMSAISDNELSATLGNSTSVTINGVAITGSKMTNMDSIGFSYYLAWQDDIDDPRKKSEMSAIIKHYTDLGYSIVRTSPNSSTITWKINWE